MVNHPHRQVKLPDRTYQAQARSEIKKVAATVEFPAKRMAELEIVIAELTSNLVKHTRKGGEILVKPLTGNNPGIELVCIDHGPGIEFTNKMMEDGMSSAKTLGHGLGAIKRLSDDFDIYSAKEWGTVILSRVYCKPREYSKNTIEVRTIMVAREGEEECGDDFDCVIKGNNLKFAISDGLGHGPEAHTAASMSIREFNATKSLLPEEQLRHIHLAIKRTRGAVMNITSIDFNNKQITYCGVGNITSKLVSAGRGKACMSYNGIVGHSVPGTMNNHVLQWNKNDMLILHSDGLSTRWDLAKYPQINPHDGTIIAAALYKDFTRRTDDVTVSIIRQLTKN